MVEHLTAAQEVPGSNLVSPLAMADSGKTNVLTSIKAAQEIKRFKSQCPPLDLADLKFSNS